MRHATASSSEAGVGQRRRGRRAWLAGLIALALAGATLAAAGPAYAAGTVAVEGTVPDVGDPLRRTVAVYLACQNESTYDDIAPGGSYSLSVPADAGAHCFVQLDGEVFDAHTQITREFVATGNDALTINFTYPGTQQVSVVGPDAQPFTEGDAWFTTSQDAYVFDDGGAGRIYTGAQWRVADGPVTVFDSPLVDYGVSLPDGNQIRDRAYVSQPEPGRTVISVPARAPITITGSAPASTGSRQVLMSARCGADNGEVSTTGPTYVLEVTAYPTAQCYVRMVVSDGGVGTVAERAVAVVDGEATADFALPANRRIRLLDDSGALATGATLEFNGVQDHAVMPDGAEVYLSQHGTVPLTGVELSVPLVTGSSTTWFSVVTDPPAATWQRTLSAAQLTGTGPVELQLPPLVTHVMTGSLQGGVPQNGYASMNCENGVYAFSDLTSSGTWSLSSFGFLARTCTLTVGTHVGGTELNYQRVVDVPEPVGNEARMTTPLAVPEPFELTVAPDTRVRNVFVVSRGTMATPDGGTTNVAGSVTLSEPWMPVLARLPRTTDGSYILYDDDEYHGGDFASAGADAARYTASTDSWTLTTGADADGVPSSIEAGAPNGGDGNGDGIADAEQPGVTSLPAATGGGYLTLASPSGTTMGPVATSTIDALPAPPEGTTLPAGLVSFEVRGLTPGGTATVRIYSPSLAGVTGWAKYHGGAWAALPASDVAVNVAGGYVDVTLTDGGPFDDDGTANGTIVDPGGPAASTDHDAPVVSCAAAPSAWSATNVSVACTASDAGSGLADAADASFALTTSVPAGTETATASTGSRQVCDVAGNCVTAGPATGIKVDRLAPVVAVTAPADGAQVAQGSALAAAYSCTDGGSGGGSCSGTVAVGQPVPTTTPGQKTFSVVATDAVGNTTTRNVGYTVVASNTAPTVRADMGVAGLEVVGTQTGSLDLTARFTDAEGNGPFTASVRWSPASAFVPATVSGTTVTATGSWPSAGTRTVTVKVCDAAGACGTDTLTVRSHVRDKVTPAARCVVDQGRSATPRYLARFGYTSRASVPLWIPVRPGKDNTFRKDPARRGQPSLFLPGTQRTAFEVPFSTGTQTWVLNGQDASASSSTRRC